MPTTRSRASTAHLLGPMDSTKAKKSPGTKARGRSKSPSRQKGGKSPSRKTPKSPNRKSSKSPSRKSPARITSTAVVSLKRVGTPNKTSTPIVSKSPAKSETRTKSVTEYGDGITKVSKVSRKAHVLLGDSFDGVVYQSSQTSSQTISSRDNLFERKKLYSDYTPLYKPAEYKPAEYKPAEYIPVEYTTTEYKTVEYTPIDYDTEEEPEPATTVVHTKRWHPGRWLYQTGRRGVLYVRYLIRYDVALLVTILCILIIAISYAVENYLKKN